MKISKITTIEDFTPLQEAWDRLSGDIPFRSWQWYATWWHHYQGCNELFVLTVRDDDDSLVAVAPWYLQNSAWKGHVIRFLGSGEVCSDYQTVLCLPGREAEVARALAEWMTNACRPEFADHGNRWDLLELTGVDAEEPAIGLLSEHLLREGNAVHRTPGLNTWRVQFPDSWENYLGTLSKSHRKQVRRVEKRLFATGRARLHTVKHRDELDNAFNILVDLHQRRWQSLGLLGCFSSEPFSAFHREMAAQMLAIGRLRLYWLELDDQPVAAEYHLAGRDIVFGYQAGVEPDRLSEEPGHLAAAATLRAALEDGYHAFDFLRGDEPYKPHWRAVSRPTIELRVVPHRPTARLRHNVWRAARHLKRRVSDVFQ